MRIRGVRRLTTTPTAECGRLTVEDAGLRDVPHSRRLHDVPDDKLLDGLVLGDAAGTVGAADWLHVPTALLGATVVPPFLSLFNTRKNAKRRPHK